MWINNKIVRTSFFFSFYVPFRTFCTIVLIQQWQCINDKEGHLSAKESGHWTRVGEGK